MTLQHDPSIAPPPILPAPQRWSRKPAVILGLVAAVMGILFVIVVATTIFLARRAYGGYSVPSEGMLPTFKPGDRVVTDKNAFTNGGKPGHGDVVVFEAPLQATNDHKSGVVFIKRVAALPGETIQVKGAQMTLDGKVFSESEGREPHEYIRAYLELDAEIPIRIASDHIQVGDSTTLTPQELAKKLGRSGAKIRLQPGQVLINGKPEVAGFKTHEDPGYDFPSEAGSFPVDSRERDGSYKVPAGHLFVLGDNRNLSADSHIWGPLDANRLQGRVILTAATSTQDQD